jgi:hypothetical protein
VHLAHFIKKFYLHELYVLQHMADIYDKLLDLAWKDYDLIFQSKTELETKANMILAADGVLLGLIMNGLSNLNKPLAIISICFLLASSYFCVRVLVTHIYEMLSVEKTWEALDKKRLLNDTAEAYENLLGTIDNSCKNNLESYKKLVEYYKPAINVFLIGLFLSGLAILIPMILPK